jgi:hypothetical protein
MIYPPNGAFRRALASRATRRINPRGRSGRGAIVCRLPAWQFDRRVVFESVLEMNVLFMLLARRDVVDLWEQPGRIRYFGEDDDTRFTVFDVLVTLVCGTKLAIAVKPAALVESSGFRQELERVKASTPLSFADDVALVTDRSFTPADARNAQRLHEFRRYPDEEADAIIAELLAGLDGPTTLADIAQRSGLDGRGFRAAFRALFTGQAKVLKAEDITPQTIITAEVAQ